MRIRRICGALVILAGAMSLVAPLEPAYAGTLTAASVGTENPFTSAKTVPYDWNFTTATSATLTRVTASVPAGTDCATRYLALNTAAGNNASTPDSVANSITGDIDIRVKVALDDWTPAGYSMLVAKESANISYKLYVQPSGLLEFDWSANGSAANGGGSSIAVPATDGSTIWVRATLDVDNGSSGRTVTYYTSADGSAWTQLGSVLTTAGVTSIYNSTDSLEIGTNSSGAGNPMGGKVYYAEVRNGINGTPAATFDPSLASTAASTWSALTGETWTVNRTGTNLPADIACDLTVNTATGVPGTGVASLRLIDDLAAYRFTATAVGSGVASSLRLTGFTNTATPGSSNSTITTYNNAGTPVSVDSVSAATLDFFATSAQTATSSSAQLTDSQPGQTTTYTITASSITTSVIRCMKINFATAADQTGIKPAGLSVTAASLNATSTWTATPASWSLAANNTSGTLTLTNATGATPGSSSGRTIVLDNITSSTAANTQFITVNTYANVNCIASPVDNTTLAYATVSGTQISVAIDPELTFIVAAHAGACNGMTQTAGVTASSNAVDLGHVAAPGLVAGAQDLTVSVNSNGGFTTYIRYGGALTGPGGKTIADWTGINSAPTSAWSAGTAAFGYTTSDATLGTGTPARFTTSGPKFAKLTTTNQEIMYNSAAGVVTECVGYMVGTSSSTSAGTYTSTVIYTAVPTF